MGGLTWKRPPVVVATFSGTHKHCHPHVALVQVPCLRIQKHHPRILSQARRAGLLGFIHPQFSASPEAVITFTSGPETHGFKYLVFDHPSVDTDMVLVSAGLSRAHCVDFLYHVSLTPSHLPWEAHEMDIFGELGLRHTFGISH